MPTVSEDIAVLKNQMTTISAQLNSVETKIDSQGTLYIPRSEWEEWKKGQNYQKILLALIVAIVTAVIEYGIFIGLKK